MINLRLWPKFFLLNRELKNSCIDQKNKKSKARKKEEEKRRLAEVEVVNVFFIFKYRLLEEKQRF